MTAKACGTDQFYAYLDELAERVGGAMHLNDPGLARRCPKAGLYFFFELGEVRKNGQPRVVRIGTHALTSMFHDRCVRGLSAPVASRRL